MGEADFLLKTFLGFVFLVLSLAALGSGNLMNFLAPENVQPAVLGLG